MTNGLVGVALGIDGHRGAVTTEETAPEKSVHERPSPDRVAEKMALLRDTVVLSAAEKLVVERIVCYRVKLSCLEVSVQGFPPAGRGVMHTVQPVNAAIVGLQKVVAVGGKDHLA